MHTFSETAPDGERTAYGELAMQMLDILTLYARLMDMIGWFARNALRQSPDGCTGGLRLSDFADSRDGEKGKLFVRLADRLGVPGDRSQFVNAYARVHGTRNYIAHASDMVALTERSEPSIAITYYEANKRRLGDLDGKSRLRRGLVAKRLREVTWMIEHVEWARVSLQLSSGPYNLGPQPSDAAPPDRPR